jgi:predicted DNA-binding protein
MAPKQFVEVFVNLPMSQELRDRIDAALVGGEKRTVFIREAIELHLKRRERLSKPKP